MKFFHKPVTSLEDVTHNFEQLETTGSGLLPSGALSMYAGATAPNGYLLCDGASYLRATYPSLFAAIGTTYGTADATHFNVPDLRGRAPIGAGTGTAAGATAHALGSTPTTGNGGEETHLLSVAELPSHNHGGFVGDSGGFAAGVANIATAAGGIGVYQRAVSSVLTIPAQGSSTAHNIMQPLTAVNFLIKT